MSQPARNFGAKIRSLVGSAFTSGLGLERLGLGYRLLLLVLSVALPLNILSFAAIRSQSRSALEAQSGNLLYSARSIAAAVNADIDTYLALARAFSRSPALLADDLDSFETEVHRAMPSQTDAWVVVADPDGKVLLNLDATADGLGRRSAIALDAQRQAFAERASVISDVHNATGSEKLVISINIPVLQHNQPFRMLAIDVRVERFLRLLTPASMPSHWLAGIIDRTGHFIARVPHNERYVGQLASTGWRNIMDRDGIFEFNSLEGDPIVQGTSHARSWSIGVAARKEALEADAWSASRPAFMLGLGISGLSLLLAAFVARTILKPLREVRDKAQGLLAGSQAALTSGAPEVQELWNALQTAVRHQQLSQSRFVSTFENAGVGMAHLDLEGHWLAVNNRLCEVTGYSREEMLTKRWQDLTDPADVSTDLEKQVDLVEGKISSYNVEKRYTRKDGTRIWVAVAVTLARTATGAPDYLISVTRNISARKEAEDRNRLLLREVNHRSKNLLTVVMAVARHTRARTAAELVDRFAERVQALSTGQDLLIRNDWKGMAIEQLIRGQLGHLTDLIDRRIELSGPYFVLPPAAGQTIGMALHELATNATKYGALSTPAGRVEIVWSLDATKFSMTWLEFAGPPVVAPDGRGFGTTVIVEMVRSGLEAEVSLEYLPTGVRWQMSCPIDNVR